MAQRSYYETLLQSGVRILQYPSPTVLHSKFMYVDDEMAFIGSSNMDPRSFSLNLEVSTFIADPAMVDALANVAKPTKVSARSCVTARGPHARSALKSPKISADSGHRSCKTRTGNARNMRKFATTALSKRYLRLW